MTVEGLKLVFDWAAVILVFFTFLAGGGVLITGNIIATRQEEKLRNFDLDLTAAKTELGKQQERAAKAEGNTALALQHAAEANTKAEHEKLERIKLEEDLSPRLFNGAREAAKRLSSFRDTSVLLEYSLDLECKATAERIAFVLTEAGWKIMPRPNNDPNPVFFEGVVVGYVGPGGVGVNPVPIRPPLPFFDNTPPNAGEVLLDELNGSGMDAHTTPGIGRISEAVYVYVGFRPSPETKRLLKITREIDRRTRDSVRKGEAPDLKDLIEQANKLRLAGAGGRLQLPTQ